MKVYVNALQTIHNIRSVIREMKLQLCENVMRDFLKRINNC